jgi:3',5'-cyclic AMP phosphodiesterase CpdA
MKRIVHLSDIHLSADPAVQERLFSSMARALEQTTTEPRAGGLGVDLVVVTGDLFDSSKLDVDESISAFERWYAMVTMALGSTTIPTVIIPGNHDVRRDGVIGPHSARLFEGLRDALSARENVIVHGCGCPFLAARVPREVHGLPAELVMLDSTYLAEGWLSAGGLIRQEDLLRIASELPPAVPLIVLAHHHLVPTPVTDLGAIDVHRYPESWIIKNVLPHLYANADHEELSMTALGVGTALTTLHMLNRAVLVLHGHKHFPVARLLRGVQQEQGDVLLAGAGSAGRAEPWRPSKHAEDALWPSFNVVDFDGVELTITTRAYPPKQAPEHGQPVSRPLLAAHRNEGEWQIVERGESWAPRGSGTRLTSNRAVFHLQGAGPNAPLWDAMVERTLKASETLLAPYIEIVDGAPEAYLDEFVGMGPPDCTTCPTRVALNIGTPNRYRLVAGLCGMFDEATKRYGARTAPYDWVDLFNRFACDEAQLVLRGFPEGMARPFGGVVDLTSGIEKPVALQYVHGDYILTLRQCPPRTLIRIFWPLATG